MHIESEGKIIENEYKSRLPQAKKKQPGEGSHQRTHKHREPELADEQDMA